MNEWMNDITWHDMTVKDLVLVHLVSWFSLLLLISVFDFFSTKNKIKISVCVCFGQQYNEMNLSDKRVWFQKKKKIKMWRKIKINTHRERNFFRIISVDVYEANVSVCVCVCVASRHYHCHFWLVFFLYFLFLLV